MQRFIQIIILIFILTSQQVFANEGCTKLTLDDAIKLAVEKNMILSQKRKDIGIAQNNISVANRLQNPKFQIMYLLGDISLGNPQQIGFEIPVEIRKRGPRKKRAEAEASRTQTSFELDNFNLKMDVREAYINYAKAKSVLNIVTKQQGVLKQTVDVAKRRYEVGVAPEIEYLQAKIIYDQLKTVFNQTKTEVEVSKYNFNKTLNIEDESNGYDIADDALPTDGQFLKLSTPNPKAEMPDYEVIEKISFKHRHDIKMAEKEIDIARKNLIVTIRQKVPNITIIGGYGYLSDWQNNDFTISEGGFLQGAYVGGEIDLPILYRYTPEIKNAKLELEKKQTNLKSVKYLARQDLMTAYANFMVARKNLNYYSDNLLGDSETVLKMSQKSYTVGKSNLSSLLIMQQANIGISMNYTLALANYYSTWIDLLRSADIENAEELGVKP